MVEQNLHTACNIIELHALINENVYNEFQN
jgi:hypothetical protein